MLKQEEEIQQRVKEHEEKKQKEKDQTLFDMQTKDTYKNLPLFSPGS